ncbi:SIR2 family protein [Microbacterium oleivorans]|uniref:Uncharacterized protein n=1 Tax=Microbacterium oleivorans TaxID=273677 RepID=A0A031FUY6_9MICO|nr:SIR2 family protein [Microbacterium oleivorans]EZP28398.1 hypothetical protein BW34_01378 [Microbacterium oleivorans]
MSQIQHERRSGRMPGYGWVARHIGGCGEAMRDAWRVLRAEHSELIEDVADAKRFVWLGSGISLKQVPGLVDLISRVLSFLRDKAISGDADAGDHEDALRQILTQYLPQETSRFEADRSGWVPKEKRLPGLASSYSDLLSIGVVGKPSDYLLMEGAKLAELYGDPSLVPGPTHLLIATLVYEGAVSKLASGNWDGLVEKALKTISADESLIDVYVDVNDPREGSGDAELAKFHGCAVLALDQPGKYRAKIIATTAQISSLHGDPDFQHMRDWLLERTTRQRSLILGLSVQDADLLAIFRLSASRSPWPWQVEHPAYVFAEPAVSPSQRTVLEVAYGTSYGDARREIDSRSALGSYAGPVVAALAIEVLAAKYQTALSRHGDLPSTVLDVLQAGVRRLVLRIVAAFGRDESVLVEFLLGPYADFMRTYFGPHSVGQSGYVPFVRGTRAQLRNGHAVLGMAADRLALVVGVLGVGEAERRWRVSLKEEARASRIRVARKGAGPGVTLIAVRGQREAIEVMACDDWVRGNEEMVLLQMDTARGASPRSPKGGLGKGRGARRRRELDWAEVAESVGSHDELLVRFETGVLL